MKKILLASLAVMTAASCGSDFEVTMQSIAGTYKPIGNTKTTGNAAAVDVYATFPACFLDNSLQIVADGTYNFIDGGTKCSPPVDHSGTWSLPSPKQMIVDGTAYAIEFDGHMMVQTISTTDNGVTTTTVITLEKQ
jgi:hypothetical protein